MHGLTDFQRGSIAAALHRMLSGETYSISTVRSSLTAAQPRARPDDDLTFLSLRLWHTIRYDDMPPGARADVTGHTLSLFASYLDCDDLDALAQAAGIEAETTATGDGAATGALLPIPHSWSHAGA
jgi:hypothetical protein